MASSRVYKAEGIVLARRNVGEADRIITVFTREYGKLRLRARGIRRVTSRRAPHLEVFVRASFVIYKGSHMDSISEVTTIDSFEAIRGRLEAVRAAYYMCELVDKLTAERQEHADIYDVLARVLSDLNESRESRLEGVSVHLLQILGFLPKNIKTIPRDRILPFIETIAERKIRTLRVFR